MGSRLDEVRAREARCFLPVFDRLPIALERASGSRAFDVDGREYVDLTAGWGVTAIGHAHPELAEAIASQAGRLLQPPQANLVYTLPQIELAEQLAELMPAPLTRSFFTSSGSEAVEGALKLAHRATGRAKFVSTQGSFHGRTLAALAVNGQPKHRERYAALLPAPHTVPFGDLDAARAAIDDATAAVIVEPIQGEGGVHVPPPGYLRGLRELCDARGALMVLDEIQTGIGRTGRWLAAEHEGVTPDITTLGKGLGGGVPIAAFVVTEAVAKTVGKSDHGGTYAGNPLTCAAASCVLRVIAREKLVARAAELGEELAARLRAFAGEHPEVVADVRGRGLLLGVELRDADRAAGLPRRSLAKGVLVNVTAGRVVRLFPALNVPEDDLWPAVETVLALTLGG